MATYNEIHHRMRCPRCGGEAQMDIELRFGDTRKMVELRIGDAYPWVPGKAVQNGGRPEGGNTEGQGYTECPICRKDFFVKAIVHNDILEAVVPDTETKPYIP